jgi:hypothetical protein
LKISDNCSFLFYKDQNEELKRIIISKNVELEKQNNKLIGKFNEMKIFGTDNEKLIAENEILRSNLEWSERNKSLIEYSLKEKV